MEPEPAATQPSIGAFDDINLGDTPQLDLSFGESGTKNAGSNFGFGGWGSNWNTTSKWGFGATDAGTTETTEATKFAKDIPVAAAEGDAWSSFGGNKKNKKKTTTTSGFDFDLGTLDENKDQNATAETDEWAGFGKKDKKSKKKGAFDEPSGEPDNFLIGTAVDEPAADDSWGTWGTAATKGKKKGKKDQNEETAPVPPPPPTAPTDIDWGAFATGSKKDKKKNKKDAFEDHAEEPAVTVVPEANADADVGWGSFGAKKDNKKKGKKNQVDEHQEEPAIVAVPEESEPAADFGWGDFGTSKKDKDKKKGKKGAFEEALGEPEATLPEPEAEADPGWGSFGANKKDKDKKKGKKNAIEESSETPPVISIPEPETEPDLGWGGLGSGKKDKKKGKKNALEEFPEPLAAAAVLDPEPEADAGWGFGSKKEKDKNKKGKKGEPAKDEPSATVAPENDSTIDTGWGTSTTKKEKDKVKKKGFSDDTSAASDANPTQFPDPDPVVNDTFSTWGTTVPKGKKGKKGLISEVNEDPVTVMGSTAATNITVADNDWMNWGATDKKKDKKGKNGTAADPLQDDALPPPPPPPPAAPELSMFDTFGSARKDKKGKKGAVSDKPKDDIVAVPDRAEFVPEPVEEDFGGWGLSAKDKKKKEREKEKEKKDKEEKERQEQEAKEREEKEKAEKEKTKTKLGKKVKNAPPTEVSKTQDLMQDSIPDFVPAAEEDTWGGGIWGSSAKSKKKGGRNAVPDLPPPAPTPPAQGLTPEPENISGLDDNGDDEWASFAPAKTNSKGSRITAKPTKVDDIKATKKGTKAKNDDNTLTDFLGEKRKDTPKEENAAKATKSFWGGTGTASTAKSKFAKDMDKDKEQTKDDIDKDLLGLDNLDDEIIGIVEEPPKKGSKTKTTSKLTKTTTKDSKESDKASKTASDRKKMGDDAFLDDLLDLGDEQADLEQLEEKKDDAWSFWGGAKKTGVKKADEGKKEITKAEMTNQKSSLKNNFKNEPEATIKAAADEPSSLPAKTSKTAMSTAKSSKTSTVLQRVKDLEESKAKAKEKGKPSEVDVQPPVPELEPLSKADSPPKKFGAASKSKFAAASNPTSAKKKEPSPPVEKSKDKKVFQDTVPGAFPGSFPAEAADDDIVDIIDLSPTDKKKTNKKSAKTKKPDNMMDDFDFDAPFPVPEAPAVPEAPPTPPLEIAAAKPTAKKERARVVRDQGASSWGFWGASPKKDTKKESKPKDDIDALSPKAKEKTPAPALSRSKSTRTAKEKEKEIEKSSKSSASDEKEKKSQSRPSKSRGSSFGGFFGGPPPVRAKPVRRPSTAASKTASSRRQSVDIDAIGLPSPPVEEAPEMNTKAAKLMGAGPGKLDRKASTKGKQKPKGTDSSPVRMGNVFEADSPSAAAPDPYPIDDDDMVMIGGLGDPLEDPTVNDPPTTKISAKKDKTSKIKSKKEVRLDRPPLRSIPTPS